MLRHMSFIILCMVGGALVGAGLFGTLVVPSIVSESLLAAAATVAGFITIYAGGLCFSKASDLI